MDPKTTKCCSCNGTGARCKFCICVKSNRKCSCCQPMKRGLCANSNSSAPTSSPLARTHDKSVCSQPSVPVGKHSLEPVTSYSQPLVRLQQPQPQSQPQPQPMQLLSSPLQIDQPRTQNKVGTSYSEFVKGKMCEAFGDSLAMEGSGNEKEDVWVQYWRKVVTFRGNHYSLPRGSIGREFIDLLAEEINCLSRQSTPSERVIVFVAVLMQKDKMVKKGAEIRRLLARRVREWRQERFPELIQEYQRCAKQLSKSHVANSERSKDHVLRVFSNLMLRGDIRSATRWLTDQTGSGAVLDPSQLVDGQSVAHILQEKHPEASQSGTRAFMPCDELPPLVDVDITGSHIN